MRALLLIVTIVGLVGLGACGKGPPKKSESNAAAAATAPAPKAAAGQTFGEGVKLSETTPIDTILTNPKSFSGKTIRVEGMVTDVCPKRGCWFEMAGTKPGQKLRFKVTDGEMVFPPDSKGKHAVAEGVLAVRELTLEETKERAKYEAEEYGKPYDPASITEPQAVVRLDGTGAIFN